MKNSQHTSGIQHIANCHINIHFTQIITLIIVFYKQWLSYLQMLEVSLHLLFCVLNGCLFCPLSFFQFFCSFLCQADQLFFLLVHLKQATYGKNDLETMYYSNLCQIKAVHVLILPKKNKTEEQNLQTLYKTNLRNCFDLFF